MHITGVTIKNFQSISSQSSKVILKDGINVLVGSSNSGKSAFLRAIKWNMTNSPAGNEFIQKGTTEASVLIEWSSGHAVERIRNLSGSKNMYILYKDGEVIEEYTGFGSGVPPLILEVTGINLNIPFNFANQLEAPFLLSDSPRSRAETIGNLEELGLIDQALGSMNDDIRFTKKEYTAKQKELLGFEKHHTELKRTVDEEKKKYEMVNFLIGAIDEKERIFKHLERLKERSISIESELHESTKNLRRAAAVVEGWDDNIPEQIEKFKRLNQHVSRLVEIDQELSEMTSMKTELLDQLSELSNFVTNMTGTYQRLISYSRRLQEIEDEKTTAASHIKKRTTDIDMVPVDLEVERYRAIYTHMQNIQRIDSDMKVSKDNARKMQGEIEELLNRFVDALQDEKICPTCTQPTEHITLETVEQHI